LPGNSPRNSRLIVPPVLRLSACAIGGLCRAWATLLEVARSRKFFARPRGTADTTDTVSFCAARKSLCGGVSGRGRFGYCWRRRGGGLISGGAGGTQTLGRLGT